jgi:hypothetical protein
MISPFSKMSRDREIHYLRFWAILLRDFWFTDFVTQMKQARQKIITKFVAATFLKCATQMHTKNIKDCVHNYNK